MHRPKARRSAGNPEHLPQRRTASFNVRSIARKSAIFAFSSARWIWRDRAHQRKRFRHQPQTALPTHRDVSGIWRPVIEMLDELCRPLANAVMEFLAEEGPGRARIGNIFSFVA